MFYRIRLFPHLIGMALAFFTAMPAFSASPYDKEHMEMYRTFVHLLNYGKENEFYEQARLYEEYLKENKMPVEYYKIKTNEGFYDVKHQHPLRAMGTAEQLDSEIRAAGDSAYFYLPTGLKGDIYKMTHNPKADSVYKQALREVGDTDPKFTLLIHMSLAEVNYLTEPEQALQWAELALNEAQKLDNMEYQSMALGMKSYLYFMLGQQEQFDETVLQHETLKQQYDSLEASGAAMGHQRFSHLFDAVMQVAKTSFQGNYDEAIEMAKDEQLNVDRQMIIFRILGMEGQADKELAHRRLVWGFTAMTILYLFVYIMGRRRLMRKIWKRERELRVALEKADAGNRVKAAFIRSMSHEIRTPLNAINGFSQVLCSSEFDLTEEERNDLKKRITSNSEAITIIINELLELAAGESVTLNDSNLMPVNVNDVCRAVTIQAEERNNKRLELLFETELRDDFTIRSNEETIKHILDKVVDNALKFTDEGSVKVQALQQDRQVHIIVTDTGSGIPEERQEDIFENFVKLDEYKEGVGLGLPICRRLAKSLGGNILLDTAYKNGSRFIVQLPS